MVTYEFCFFYFIIFYLDTEKEPRRITRSRVQDKSNIPISLFCSMINTSVLNNENVDKMFDTTTEEASKTRKPSKPRKPSKMEKTVVQQDTQDDTEAVNKTTSNATLNKSNEKYHLLMVMLYRFYFNGLTGIVLFYFLQY